MAFCNATRKGYAEYRRVKHVEEDEDEDEDKKTIWDKFIEFLEKDERFDASKKEPIQGVSF